MKFGLRVAAPAAWAALLLLLPGSLAAAPAPREDVLSSEPGRMAPPAPGEDMLTTLPPGEPREAAPPSPALPAAEGPPPVPASGAGVEILNGSGFGGHAAFWARRLREQGLTIARVANAERLDHPQTLIYYAEGAESVAIEVRRILGRTGKLQPRKPAGRHPVVVVLGRDLPRSDAKRPGSR
ncbi:MAG: hypothetical protein A3J27_03000 [Candidatus Tectomicrobia bacterium RIFCSPLOWO2_12_FULL_69_37]|nr:MAG: hypothetical protein A3J27_03000 [Candidatus Tectomicrobia bacterium RIFCSPLOWO2_12_FULL_69_37]OGL64203.1 MAG: hypothetical protein A3I72_11705 [Candidatus Tectomicrobia bacterium RIFCSPLOWO2_02_FULL_70_19]